MVSGFPGTIGAFPRWNSVPASRSSRPARVGGEKARTRETGQVGNCLDRRSGTDPSHGRERARGVSAKSREEQAGFPGRTPRGTEKAEGKKAFGTTARKCRRSTTRRRNRPRVKPGIAEQNARGRLSSRTRLRDRSRDGSGGLGRSLRTAESKEAGVQTSDSDTEAHLAFRGIPEGREVDRRNRETRATAGRETCRRGTGDDGKKAKAAVTPYGCGRGEFFEGCESASRESPARSFRVKSGGSRRA